MRESEEETRNWSSLAWLSEHPTRPPSSAGLEKSPTSSSIGVIYKDAQKDYDMVRFMADQATSQAAAAAIASYVDTQSGSKGVPVLVFNPLSWERTDLVDFTVQLPQRLRPLKLSTCPARCSTEKVRSKTQRPTPSPGFRAGCSLPGLCRWSMPGQPPGVRPPGVQVSADGHTLENQFLRVTVDPEDWSHDPQPDQQEEQF